MYYRGLADKVHEVSQKFIEKRLAPKIVDRIFTKGLSSCVHGSALGLCKHGCKK